jgi:short-subunit dehydrogenase
MQALGSVLVAQGAGHIVCTASAAGLADTPTLGPYSATKHAVVGLAAALRHEIADRGVGVSVLCPGLVDTRIFESERNAPNNICEHRGDIEVVKGYRDALTQAGAPPAQVAEFVLRAVLDDQFFVFPSTDFDPGAEGRIAAIRQGFAWRDAAS